MYINNFLNYLYNLEQATNVILICICIVIALASFIALYGLPTEKIEDKNDD